MLYLGNGAGHCGDAAGQSAWEAFNGARHAIEPQGEEQVSRNQRSDRRIAFRDGGIAATPATTIPSQNPETCPSWTQGIHLTGYGKPNDIQPAAKAQRQVAGTRVQYPPASFDQLSIDTRAFSRAWRRNERRASWRILLVPLRRHAHCARSANTPSWATPFRASETETERTNDGAGSRGLGGDGLRGAGVPGKRLGVTSGK